MANKTVVWGSTDDEEDRGPTFEAGWPGNCEGCGERFEAGEAVFYRDGDLYVDHGCEADGPEEKPTTCPDCFQTYSKSGACGC